ncbi:hypothetical protein ACJX0J_031552 [Zea mays]
MSLIIIVSLGTIFFVNLSIYVKVNDAFHLSGQVEIVLISGQILNLKITTLSFAYAFMTSNLILYYVLNTARYIIIDCGDWVIINGVGSVLILLVSRFSNIYDPLVSDRLLLKIHSSFSNVSDQLLEEEKKNLEDVK